MCRVEITIAMHAVICSPFGFRDSFIAKLYSTTGNLFSVVEFYRTKIMLITALEMCDFSEEALAYHVEHCHYISSITYVFHSEEWDPCVFTGVNKAPAFLYI